MWSALIEPFPIGPAPTNLASLSDTVVTLVLSWKMPPLFESWIPMALRNHEPRTAVDVGVGVCEDISEIQCGGHGGQ